jgi:hypothetical protein
MTEKNDLIVQQWRSLEQTFNEEPGQVTAAACGPANAACSLYILGR